MWDKKIYEFVALNESWHMFVHACVCSHSFLIGIASFSFSNFEALDIYCPSKISNGLEDIHEIVSICHFFKNSFSTIIINSPQINSLLALISPNWLNFRMYLTQLSLNHLFKSVISPKIKRSLMLWQSD